MTTTEPRPRMPAIECTPWCEYGDGHPDDWCQEDQNCWSPATYVDLSQMPVWREDGGDYPQQIGVMARKNVASIAEVRLHLLDIQLHGPIPPPYDNLDHGLTLTPDEAVRLAEALTEAAHLARSDGTNLA